ncbi:family 10 glycosylhydrolase [Geitlerinema sp. PCC 7407]|uniref:family 10 glycosylhydrolase n=1 Tax=Geitlerinema sp. PCC 7407 TaxID=1173025 RepID=UPI00029FE4D7|nr:family 10 glycosylhydrolase [Geitlerinema sp. PCC 7407]AFY66025.1 protein of unknown function DUF187 [Geitlerinema sp. PCC 7407]
MRDFFVEASAAGRSGVKSPALGRSPLAAVYRAVTGAVAGLLVGVSTGIMPAIAQSSELTVIRSPENLSIWLGITSRLQASGIPYQVLELQDLDELSDLGGVQVLFLPNLKSLSPAQSEAIAAWVKQGGRVIASGPVATQSAPDVRQQLRLALGGYWAFSLSQPAKLDRVDCVPTQPCVSAWASSTDNARAAVGGVVIPTGLASQTAATWAMSDRPPAVVTTDRATFFGWTWGAESASSVAMDSSWLKAAIARYGTVTPPIAAGSSSRPTTPAAAPVTAPPNPTAPSISRAATPVPQPAPTAQATAPAPRSPSPSAPPSRPTTLGAQGAGAITDPAEQSAPPGLEVQRGSQPITTLEAIAMGQELNNLLGRVESALLAANAHNTPISLERPESVAASPKAQATGDPEPAGTLAAALPTAVALNGSGPAVLQEARRIAKAFPDLVAKKDYATARSEWLRARQLLWNNYPTDRPRAHPEVRALWLDRGTIVKAGSEAGLRKVFDRLADAGINTVFFETVNAGYPVYPSAIAPQQNPLTRQWDPLAAAVKLAHERDMELHAWVWAFAAGNERHNALLNLPASYPGPLIAANPDWANYDDRGSLIPPGQGKPFLDPANPEVRSYLTRLLGEIVSRYDVDGVQLDYIRYPFQDPSANRSYGYGKAARAQFKTLTGVDPTTISPRDQALWQRWTEFRTQQIDSFVAQVSQQLRRQKPDLILSVAVFPLSEHERIQKLQQHWETWAKRGDIDWVVPMTYALDTNRFERLATPWLGAENLGSALILPGIRLLNLPTAVTLDQIQLLRDEAAAGYALFAAENLDEALQGIFSRTQGNSDLLPQRQPYGAALERFDALQREWSFLLGQEQLWLREPELTELRTQAEELRGAIAALQETPSSAEVAAAKAALSRFQAKFPSWMHLHKLQNGYQVTVWQNRLDAIEALLRYGDRPQS